MSLFCAIGDEWADLSSKSRTCWGVVTTRWNGCQGCRARLRAHHRTRTVGWLAVNLNGAAGARIGYPRTLSATEGSGNVDLTVFRVAKSKRSSSGAARRLTISSERGCAPNVHTQSPTPALLRIRRERHVSHHTCGQQATRAPRTGHQWVLFQ